MDSKQASTEMMKEHKETKTDNKMDSSRWTRTGKLR